MIEHQPAEVMGQNYVGVYMQSPAVVLEEVKSSVNPAALAKHVIMSIKQVGWDTGTPVFLAHILRPLILVRSNYNQLVALAMILSNGVIQDIIETYTDGYNFNSLLIPFEQVMVGWHVILVVHVKLVELIAPLVRRTLPEGCFG